MLTVETFVCKAFRTHAHTKQPTIQNSTSALWLLLLRLLLLCKGGQLFPNVHAAVTLAWFPNNNNVTQTFHRSKSDQNITLAGKEGVLETCSLNDLNICYTPHYVMKKESLLLSRQTPLLFSRGRKTKVDSWRSSPSYFAAPNRVEFSSMYAM